MLTEIIDAARNDAWAETLRHDIPAFLAVLAFVSIVAAYIG